MDQEQRPRGTYLGGTGDLNTDLTNLVSTGVIAGINPGLDFSNLVNHRALLSGPFGLDGVHPAWSTGNDGVVGVQGGLALNTLG